MQQDFIQELEREKIIAVIRGVQKARILPLVTALYEGGIRFIEVTFPQDEDNTETFAIIKLLSEEFGGKMHVGSGTVLTEEQVVLTKKAGGEFVISPDTYANVIQKTKELGLISVAGAYTPTEIMTAVRLGADFVKLFPASVLGTSYIKAIKAPLKNVRLLAFGGVDIGNLKDFVNVGVCGFGIGSDIVDKKLLDKGDYNGIRELAKKHTDIIKR